MKKWFLVALTFMSIISLAQTSVFQIKDKDNNSQTVNEGSLFYHATKPNITINDEFEIKNTSASSVSLSLRKYEDLINTVDAANDDMGHAYFCFGTNCLPSTVFSYSIVLAVGESALLEAKFDEASIAGHSIVRYKVSNKLDANDALSFSLKYDTNVGLGNNTIKAADFFEIYPNPSNDLIYIQQKNIDLSIQTISIINNFGQEIVSNHLLNINSEKGICISTQDLDQGIYFIRILCQGQTISKKITILK